MEYDESFITERDINMHRSLSLSNLYWAIIDLGWHLLQWAHDKKTLATS